MRGARGRGFVPGSPGPPPAPPPSGPRRPGLPWGWGRAEVEAGTSGTPVLRWFPEGRPTGRGVGRALHLARWRLGVTDGRGRFPRSRGPRSCEPEPTARPSGPRAAGSRQPAGGLVRGPGPRSSRPTCPGAAGAPAGRRDPGSLRRGTPPEPGPGKASAPTSPGPGCAAPGAPGGAGERGGSGLPTRSPNRRGLMHAPACLAFPSFQEGGGPDAKVPLKKSPWLSHVAGFTGRPGTSGRRAHPSPSPLPKPEGPLQSRGCSGRGGGWGVRAGGGAQGFLGATLPPRCL